MACSQCSGSGVAALEAELGELEWLITRFSHGSDMAREKSSTGGQAIEKSSALVASLWRWLCKLSNRISTIAEKSREYADVQFFHHVQNAMLK
jgi:hypothetical protein